MNPQRQEIKNAYLKGKEISSICTLFDITRSTFYYHKKKAKEAGDDWDEAFLREKRGEEEIKASEEYFLATLIASFEKALLEGANPSLEKLNKYAQTYWKLKAPKNDDEFKLKDKLREKAELTIKELAHLALELEQKEVIDFLSTHHEEIIKRVFK
ncbi:hypothetical protein BBW65_07050 [Helicobacter enhydrae]|uniref:Uncharacterized protein n=1 Tax=Helicobacter enhydrae TaxID=222136 RepID=A0A1B1U746_9HELI|nr:DUF1804 family protein [Helicobacter enhydrae]ANV98295.1 hypothetical protein BBW65_05550 [Helicobacter enhydrae]ANV98566.1 hypothetical protein BBW65_07050 [Helicobacter enhydrae]